MVKAQSGPTNDRVVLVTLSPSKGDEKQIGSESCSGAKICCSKERPGSSPGHPIKAPPDARRFVYLQPSDEPRVLDKPFDER
jgi:hypothetical protein